MVSTACMWIVCFVVIVLYWFVQSKGGRTPPGPHGLPVVGYLPFLNPNPHLKLMELQKVYGPVYSLHLGNQYVVVIADFASIRKVFSQDVSAESPKTGTNEENSDSDTLTGLPWKEHRRLVLQLLVKFGTESAHIHQSVEQAIQDLLGQFTATSGRPTAVTPMLTAKALDSIVTLLFGRQLLGDRRSFGHREHQERSALHEDPRRATLDKLLHLSDDPMSWRVFLPWANRLAQFFTQRIAGGRVSDATKNIEDYIWQEIKEHQTTLNPNFTRGFLGDYLMAIRKRSNDPTFKREVLKDLVTSLLRECSEPVRVALEWLLVIMAANQTVQKRVQSEIDDVISWQRPPSRTDQFRMPYSTAAILETMRWRTIKAIGPFRYTSSDTELGGFFIPKSSIVIANLWAVDHDAQLWGADADTYTPDRFLSEDRKTVKKIEHFKPFSIGTRSCPGSSEAEIFLYFTSILQRFHVNFPPGHRPDLDGVLGHSLAPKPQRLCFVQRRAVNRDWKSENSSRGT